MDRKDDARTLKSAIVLGWVVLAAAAGMPLLPHSIAFDFTRAATDLRISAIFSVSPSTCPGSGGRRTGTKAKWFAGASRKARIVLEIFCAAFHWYLEKDYTLKTQQRASSVLERRLESNATKGHVNDSAFVGIRAMF